MQSGAQCAVQAVLEIEVASPFDDMGEQVSEERGVLVEQRRELQGVLGGDQLIEPDLARRQGRPVPRRECMVGVRSPIAHTLEDHAVKL